MMKVYLDIDDVLADFCPHYFKHFNLPTHEAVEYQDKRFDRVPELKNNKEFWLSIPPLTTSSEIYITISGYCTARDISVEWVEEWLEKNNFPKGQVICTGFGTGKLKALKENECTVMLDDGIHNFEELNNGGIRCYLLTRPHNINYDAGVLRVDSIQEFQEKVTSLFL